MYKSFRYTMAAAPTIYCFILLNIKPQSYIYIHTYYNMSVHMNNMNMFVHEMIIIVLVIRILIMIIMHALIECKLRKKSYSYTEQRKKMNGMNK